MRLGLNLLYLIPGEVGGTETYARELVMELSRPAYRQHHFILYLNRESASLFTPSSNITLRVMPLNARNRAARLLFEQLLLPLYILRDKPDLLLSLGYSSPWLSPVKSVVVIHDLNWHYHPEDFSPIAGLLWRITVTLSAATSDHVITDSTTSAESLTEVLKQPAAKITPILHAAPHTVKSAKLEFPRRFLLTVVAAYPHKNLLTLLKAFRQLASSYPELSLVVCGLGGKATTEIESFLSVNQLQGRVQLLGYVTREELAALYRACEIFVFPSAYEGFGYPPLEAMSYNAPVVSSSAFSLTEVVGGGGILVDPHDHAQFAEAISSLLDSPGKRRALAAKGTSRIRELSWTKTANETLAVIMKVGQI